MLKRYQNSELSRSIGSKLTLERLLGLLMSRVGKGSVSFAHFDLDKFVVRIVFDGGRVLRGYGKSLVDAVRTIAHQVFCVDTVVPYARMA